MIFVEWNLFFGRWNDIVVDSVDFHRVGDLEFFHLVLVVLVVEQTVGVLVPSYRLELDGRGPAGPDHLLRHKEIVRDGDQ